MVAIVLDSEILLTFRLVGFLLKKKKLWNSFHYLQQLWLCKIRGIVRFSNDHFKIGCNRWICVFCTWIFIAWNWLEMLYCILLLNLSNQISASFYRCRQRTSDTHVSKWHSAEKFAQNGNVGHIEMDTVAIFQWFQMPQNPQMALSQIEWINWNHWTAIPCLYRHSKLRSSHS